MGKLYKTLLFALLWVATIACSTHKASGQVIDLGRGEQSTPLIEEIAAALNYDSLAIFNWVLTKVEYAPYYGLRQGAHVTALEMQGNDYDQCVLLVSLLKQSGVPAANISYIEADVTYSAAEIADWLKWDLSLASVTFDSLGIPRTAGSGPGVLRRVFVRVVIGGTTYTLDPAFKRTVRTDRLGLADVYSGYSAASVTSQAGVTPPSDDEVSMAISNIDNFQNTLATISSNYVQNAAINYHGRDARSVLGIPVLDEPERTALPTALSQSYAVLSTWTEIPDGRAAKVRFGVDAAGGWTSPTYNWCDLAEDVLSLRFTTVGGPATLYRESQVESTEPGPVSGNLALTTWFTFPQDPANEIPFPATPMTRSGRSVILPSFGASRGRLKRMTQVQAELANSAPDSDNTWVHTLALLGLQRAVLDDNALAIVGAMTERYAFDRGSVWFFHERAGSLTVDGPSSLVGMYRIRPTGIEFGNVFESWVPWGSATEHLSLEQMSTFSAKSTVAVIESALRDGRKILRLRKDNWTAQMAQIEGGESGVLAGVKDFVGTTDDNKRAFVPSKLSVPIFGSVNNLTGSAAILTTYNPSDQWRYSYTWKIDGGFNGAETNDGAGAVTQSANNTNNATDNPAAPPHATGADPVDLVTGAFMYEAPGLKVGNDSGPTSLDFRHFYNSGQRRQNTAQLNPGWTHSYDLFLALRHTTDLDLRAATVAEVAPLVVAMQYLLDIVTPAPSAKEMALRALAVNWAARNFLKSKATVALGERRIEFHRLADGSYIQSSSLPATFEQLADGSHRLAFRHGNTISFRASDDKATSIVDPFNNTLSLTYQTDGKLSQVTDAYNRVLTFAYGASGLTSVSDSTGRSITYDRVTDFVIAGPDIGTTTTFDWDFGVVIGVIDARGRTIIENEYDDFYRVWAQRPLGDGNKTTFIHYAPGITREADPYGHGAWTTFDPRGRRVAHRDALGNVQRWEYDGADRVTKAITPRGATTTYSYDADHVLRSETNPANDTRTFETDSESRPRKVRPFGGLETQETVFTYTPEHQVATITAPGNIVTSFTYDSRGRVSTHHPAAYAAGVVDTYTYDANGHIDKITYPGGGFDDYSFASRGDLTEIVDRNGAKTTFGYNNRRLRTSITQWEGSTQYTTQTVYDAAGDVDYTLDASGRKVDQDYNALGDLLEIKRGAIGSQVPTLTNVYETNRLLLWKSLDALNNETEFAYDAAQRLTGTYDPLDRLTQFDYDADGNPTTLTTPMNFSATTAYQLTGWEDGTTNAENQTIDHQYDKDGRPTALFNRLNRSFTWAYNDATRTVTSKTPRQQPGGPDSTKSTVETRSARGLLDSIVEPSGQTITFSTYDSEGRLTQKTDGVGTTSYTYWPNGLLKEVTEGGRTTHRGYDTLNRLNEYRDGEGNTLLYDYHPSGELKEITYPDGIKKVTYSYDDFGRLSTVTDWASRVTTYSYDAAGRLTRIDRPNGTYRIQEYDAASQLRFIKEYKSDGTVVVFNESRYDDDGRIVYSFLHPKPGDFTLPTDSMLYDDDNRMSHWNSGTPNVIFDEDGNMTTGPLPSGSLGTHTYDARNRLTLAGGSTYHYNPDGQRVEITGTGAATFVIDPNAVLSRTLMRTKGGVTTYYVYGLGLLYEETSGATKTYHFNQVGSTLAITDGNQTVTDLVGYSPFGTVTERTDPAGTPTDTPFLSNGEFGVMTDGNWDSSLGAVTGSGLIYMRNRYYNPRLMRFLNADPIGFGGGLNWYAFVGNNPVSFLDPWGLKDIKSQVSHVDENDITQMTAYRVNDTRAPNIGASLGSQIVNTGLAMIPGYVSGQNAEAAFRAGNIGPGFLWTAVMLGEEAVVVFSFGRVALTTAPARPVLSAAESAPTLSNQALRGIRSLEKQIAAHEAKLAEFIKNPTVRPGMEGQSQAVIKAAQEARIRHLQREVDAFKGNIEKLKNGGG